MSDPDLPPCDESEFEISAGLIESVCDVLDATDETRRASLRHDLHLYARSYLEQKGPFGFACPKTQRTALRKLQKSITRTLAGMLEVSPEFVVALDIARGTAGEPALETARQALLELHQAISKFDELYHPPKGPAADVPLEEAVRGLYWVIEELTGEFPRAKMNKHTDCRPELESVGARAIGLLLKGVDPALSDTKIANMIEKVHIQPNPTLTNLDVLIRINPENDLDASLLAGRRGTKGLKF